MLLPREETPLDKKVNPALIKTLRFY